MMSYGESRLFLASMLIVLCTLTLWVGRAFGAPATSLLTLAAIFLVWIFWLAWTYDRGQRGSLRPPVRPRGQGGYQPQSPHPIDPMAQTPPTGGSAIQPPEKTVRRSAGWKFWSFDATRSAHNPDKPSGPPPTLMQ